ncbi:MAG: HAD-IIIA family hydrolase [Deltaproteobacteria bacterium]|nr:HAD-IIIA family hydrolase [Deltaproteobacteria bacterium]
MTTSKLNSREALVGILGNLRAKGQKIAYTSGVFDLLHRGHVEYLQDAKKEADILVVGVNSDSSVKQNKGDFRPICSEQDRAAVIAGLACVDYVFIFSDKNNNENIKLLKPDVYVKAGDYSKEKLSSASIVESYGGRVALVPFAPGYSTTSIIDRVLDGYVAAKSDFIALPPPEKRPAIFLDRDGTLNEHVEYLGDPKKFKMLPGVIEAIKGFNDLGYRVAVITNQPGIGMGYFTLEDFYRVTRELLAPVGKSGARIDKVYFCPHSHAENCTCRKPKAGLVERAVKDLNVDLSQSVMIGDTTVDVETARRAGVKSILLKTGLAGTDKGFDAKPDYTADNILAAFNLVKSELHRK